MDSPCSPPGSRPVVAVVDDEPHVCQFLETALSPIGADVAPFGSVGEFIAGLDARPFQCAVIDFCLPDGTGLEAAAAVRSRRLATGMVLVSGFANVRLAVQALRHGVIDVLEKPFAAADLVAAVQKGLLHCQQREAEARRAREIQTRVASLTQSEREVLDQVLEGQPNKIIARKLNMGLRTVESRKQHLYQKLAAGSVSELVQIALAAGIFPSQPSHAAS